MCSNLGYDECISAVSAIDPTIPIVISDAWDIKNAIEYSLKKNTANSPQPTSPIIIDTHFYWTFTDVDKAKSPQQIIAEVDTKLSELDRREVSAN